MRRASTVTFDGYTYDLVAIGDQCWFAENLRNEHYANGDAIPGDLSNGEWRNTTAGLKPFTTTIAVNLADYGRLYNWYAVDDARGLCPSGWHVPTDGEFMTLEMELGMSESEANDTGWRGTDQGTQMKSSALRLTRRGTAQTRAVFQVWRVATGAAVGTSSSGGGGGFFWSASSRPLRSTLLGAVAWVGGDAGVLSGLQLPSSIGGFSVRCVRD